jgi:HNH endonuclease/NUMOD4 motif
MPTIQPTFTAEEIQSEIWKQVPGYEGSYEISSLSRPRSLKTYHGRTFGHILRVSPMAGGYLKVTLSKNAKLRTWAIHILVARAFLGPPPEGKEVNHIDGNKLNNRADNLEYVTRKKNVEHAVAHGLTPSSAERSETMKVFAARGLSHGTRTKPEAYKQPEYHLMSVNLLGGVPQVWPKLTEEELAGEEWREIPGYEFEYQESDLARTRSVRVRTNSVPGKILKPNLTTRGGRPKLELFKDGKGRTFNVASLVAMTFLGPANGRQVNHKSGNKLDARLKNLEYLTREENIMHAMMNGLCPSGDRHYSRKRPWLLARGHRQPNAKISDEQRKEIHSRYATGTETYASLAAEFGLHWTTVRHITRGKPA